MKKELFSSLVILFILTHSPATVFPLSPDHLVVADFNSGHKPNNLGQEWGSWNYDPTDPEQGTRDRPKRDDYKNPEKGYCIRLNYDVQSSRPAFSGFWMKLGGLDVTPYEWLSLWVRGDASGKFTKRFKLELKNNPTEAAVYLVDNIVKEWKEVRIPFKKNSSITDWSRLDEFVIVFDDILATYKEGTIFIDNIEFQK